MFELEEDRDALVEKIEDLLSRKQYAPLRDLLLPLEAADIAALCGELGEKVPPRYSWSWTAISRSC